MKAVVIESGKDKLIPLTLGCPKLMLNIMDRPLIYHIKDYLSKWGIEIGGVIKTDDSYEFPVEFRDIVYTVKDMSIVEEYLKKRGEDILIISQPVITDISLNKIISFCGKEILKLLCRGKETGIYYISKNSDLLNPIIKKISAGGYFSSLANGEEYISCHRDVLRGKLKLNTEECIKNKGVIIGENTMLKIGAQIKPPVYIGKGTVIESGAKIEAYSVIGADCVISSGVSTGGSVINKGCFIGKGAVLKKSLIAPLARIKKNAVIGEYSMVGEASVIGEAAMICDKVKVWNGKYVPDGNEITENLVKGGRIPVFKFKENTVTGKAGVDFTPEDVCRLGACVSRLNPNLKIAVAASSGSSTLMIKYAFISGIMSVGGEVVDLGTVPEYILRFAVSELKAASGVYIEDFGETKISFYGRDYKKCREKDMERLSNMYPEPNFARTEASGIKEPSPASNISELYYGIAASFFKKCKTSGFVYCGFSKCEEEYVSYLSKKTGLKTLPKRKTGYISAIAEKDGFFICDEEGNSLSVSETKKLCEHIIKKEYGSEKKDKIFENDRVFAFFKLCMYILEKKLQLKNYLVFFENT